MASSLLRKFRQPRQDYLSDTTASQMNFDVESLCKVSDYEKSKSSKQNMPKRKRVDQLKRAIIWLFESGFIDATQKDELLVERCNCKPVVKCEKDPKDNDLDFKIFTSKSVLHLGAPSKPKNLPAKGIDIEMPKFIKNLENFIRLMRVKRKIELLKEKSAINRYDEISDIVVFSSDMPSATHVEPESELSLKTAESPAEQSEPDKNSGTIETDFSNISLSSLFCHILNEAEKLEAGRLNKMKFPSNFPNCLEKSILLNEHTIRMNNTDLAPSVTLTEYTDIATYMTCESQESFQKLRDGSNYDGRAPVKQFLETSPPPVKTTCVSVMTDNIEVQQETNHDNDKTKLVKQPLDKFTIQSTITYLSPKSSVASFHTAKKTNPRNKKRKSKRNLCFTKCRRRYRRKFSCVKVPASKNVLSKAVVGRKIPSKIPIHIQKVKTLNKSCGTIEKLKNHESSKDQGDFKEHARHKLEEKYNMVKSEIRKYLTAIAQTHHAPFKYGKGQTEMSKSKMLPLSPFTNSASYVDVVRHMYTVNWLSTCASVKKRV